MEGNGGSLINVPLRHLLQGTGKNRDKNNGHMDMLVEIQTGYLVRARVGYTAWW
jgi:hypothetical protein